MTWTTEVPTKPGFYYWQGGGMTGDEVAIVQVNAFRDKTRELEGDELLLSQGSVRRKKHLPVSEFGGRWAGPLPQPGDLRT